MQQQHACIGGRLHAQLIFRRSAKRCQSGGLHAPRRSTSQAAQHVYETDNRSPAQTSAVASTSGRGGGAAVWAAVINFERQGKADAGEAEAKAGSKKGARYIVDVLANCAEDSVPGHGPKRCPA